MNHCKKLEYHQKEKKKIVTNSEWCESDEVLSPRVKKKKKKKKEGTRGGFWLGSVRCAREALRWPFTHLHTLKYKIAFKKKIYRRTYRKLTFFVLSCFATRNIFFFPAWDFFCCRVISRDQRLVVSGDEREYVKLKGDVCYLISGKFSIVLLKQLQKFFCDNSFLNVLRCAFCAHEKIFVREK